MGNIQMSETHILILERYSLKFYYYLITCNVMASQSWQLLDVWTSTPQIP